MFGRLVSECLTYTICGKGRYGVCSGGRGLAVVDAGEVYVRRVNRWDED